MLHDVNKIRNVAIIAHVDHGKTSLVDRLLKEARVFRDNQAVGEFIMDRHDIEKERGITIFSKACAVEWKGVRINIIDTPGNSDFGGEVERVVRMADAALILVCAADGPMPQTRFVLRKALSHGLKLVVVVNKCDRKDGRPIDSAQELVGLLIDLEAPEDVVDAPIIYASAREGKAARSMEEFETVTDVSALLDTIIASVPPPKVDRDAPLQMAVSQIDWDDYLGRITVGKVTRGTLRVGQTFVVAKPDGRQTRGEVKKLFHFEGLGRVEADVVGAGDIIALAGLDEVDIGDTLCDPDKIDPVPPVKVDAPTVSMRFSATDSPFRGKEGDKITTRQLRDRLYREAKANVALRISDTETMDSLEVCGRGVLHLGILIEEMRREGYEFQVSRPKVIEQTSPTGERLEPMEICVVDVLEQYQGKVIEILGGRRGEMIKMHKHGNTVRLEFLIPARGLIGVRARILNATCGEATFVHQFQEYAAYRGPIPGRNTGVLIASDPGKVRMFGLDALQDRGTMFVEAGDEVYVGQIVGQHVRVEDIDVNVCKEKALTNMRASSSDRKMVVAPARTFGVEEALEFIEDDELVEVTPKSVRMRKRILDEKKRRREKTKEKMRDGTFVE
ncbi:MAG: translational GTPase TypA [Planctomycetota bacterium]